MSLVEAEKHLNAVSKQFSIPTFHELDETTKKLVMCIAHLTLAVTEVANAVQENAQ